MILPRHSLLPVNEAIWAKIRLEVPESPSWLRFPGKASIGSRDSRLYRSVPAEPFMAVRDYRIMSPFRKVTPEERS
jgi:hypothetical protein